MYPLRFTPVFKRYLWGGRRLSTLLGKPIGPESDYAESWELVDHQQDQSIVSHGPLAGKSLHELMESHGPQLLGEPLYSRVRAASRPPSLQGRFPLLLKFLDAHKTLSVQVHPNDRQAQTLEPPDLGKTEAWYVLDAQPGSLIYAGLRPNVKRGDVERAVADEAFDQVLHRFEPAVGDCILVPAGTVHAIGAGLVMAEIQQASNTTYRLFDWNRVDAAGNRRPLHVQQALDVIDYRTGPVTPRPRPGAVGPGGTELVKCDKFRLCLWHLSSPDSLHTNGRFRILSVIQGQLQIGGTLTPQALALGETVLIPACLHVVDLQPLGDRCEFLEVSIP